MSSNVSTSTRLSSFQNLDFREFQDYVIEDTDFLDSIVARVIEDTELVIYTLAKDQGAKIADKNLTAKAIFIYGHQQGFHLTKFPENALVNPERIKGHSKSPVKPDDEAIVLFSKFVNLHLFNAIRAAAEQAREEGTQTITQQHFFTWCHHLPYPLNVYLC